MQKLMMAMAAVFVWLSVVECCLAAHLQEDRYTDRDQMGVVSSGGGGGGGGLVGAGELASWLIEMARQNERLHKRNSEIINSLLGLPKVLNDAGR